MSATTAFSAGTKCRACGADEQRDRFCEVCGRFMFDGAGKVERVTFTRRFFGDYLLESVLAILTLFIGWLIWLAFTAQTSQTPAKRLLNVYIVDSQTGLPVSAGRVWVRELLVKGLLLGLLSSLTSGIAGFVNGIWVCFDRDRQALHDKVSSTVVVYAPDGLPEQMRMSNAYPARRAAQPSVADAGADLRELRRLHEEGILTDEEYEVKRAALAKRL